jgi:hypothetical protein
MLWVIPSCRSRLIANRTYFRVNVHFHSQMGNRLLRLVLVVSTIRIRLRLKKNLHGLSPRANYTDQATASYRRSDCQLFADRGCHVVNVTDPYHRILGFLDRSRYFSIK